MIKSIEMNLYIDVDGVLLGRNEDDEIALIPDIEGILRYTKANFKCFWLTTHGRYGAEDVICYLRPYAKELDLSLFNHIQAAPWNSLKTEAIDFSKPFIWIDDKPLQVELLILKDKGCFNSWLHVDTFRDFYDLTVTKIQEKQQQLQRTHFLS